MTSPLVTITSNEKIDSMFLSSFDYRSKYAGVYLISLSVRGLEILKLHPFKASVADCVHPLTHARPLFLV